MRPFKRISAWIPTLAGLCLLGLASQAGTLATILALLPGSLLLAGGVICLLAPDIRTPQHIATGAVLGVLLALPLGLAGGAALGFQALGLCLAGFLAAGRLAIALEPELEGVPAPDASLGYCARVGLDAAMINVMSLSTPPPSREVLGQALRESAEAHALFEERGWIADPSRFHREPPVLEKVEVRPVNIRKLDMEHLSFESGYDPDPAIPARERWLSYRENRTCHAWVLRRPGPGPWLLGVHGAGMGDPKSGVPAFRVEQMHEQFGLNVALIALPVHGPRSPGGFSGKEFLGVSPLDFVHAESQSMWDIRRLIGWMRREGATQVGVHGISLGAYTSALLAGLEDGLACVIAGVPPCDLVHTEERMATSFEARSALAVGIQPDRQRAIHRVVSPLALAPRLEHKRRFIYAATGDQFVPIEQVQRLWLHWERPRIGWCTGGHVSALMQRAPRELVDEAVAASFQGAGPRA